MTSPHSHPSSTPDSGPAPPAALGSPSSRAATGVVADSARGHDPQRQRGRSIRSTVARYPLITFFVLANLLSWAAWTPYILSNNGLGVWDYSFPEWLGTSQFAGVLPGAYLGPIASALLVTALADGRAGLRAWAKRLWKWRVGFRWYVVTIVGVPAAIIASTLVFSEGQLQAPSLMVIAAFVPGLVLQMVTTGLAEEPGWRDFALPRLQARFAPLTASFILGPLWALWHMPLFLSDWGGWPDASWWRPLEFAAFCIAFNVVMTWVFNRTGQSLPLSMLMHVSVNNFVSIAWSEMFPTLNADTAQHALLFGSTIAAVLVVAATRGRLGATPRRV
ncbi:type II CAAX endopeptidase family protein [Paramicrobacterium agarici]|uniref:type II CAAX endopeptidase family protein n=1 Tax=Paramicrobacterium agarici TaxID=630514 RepID=UPI00116AB8CD|nr:type II CAAX endopeptidase family protein [Microbacterium agarici]TQO22804.1 membrane protease YdiL (CAAX protease family) [Microbacterium agarici]